MAQAGSNVEKNWGSKISLDCPFKYILFNQCIINFYSLHRVICTASFAPRHLHSKSNSYSYSPPNALALFLFFFLETWPYLFLTPTMGCLANYGLPGQPRVAWPTMGCLANYGLPGQLRPTARGCLDDPLPRGLLLTQSLLL